ncbi:hypothetical protein Syun_027588 [Stephania yunnanensis]|uniref:Uncharacterized protein n=1 Tax=Stephania yunnanensis TaxID=152371 RepID=A0AAP0EJ75_9MAGN
MALTSGKTTFLFLTETIEYESAEAMNPCSATKSKSSLTKLINQHKLNTEQQHKTMKNNCV